MGSAYRNWRRRLKPIRRICSLDRSSITISPHPEVVEIRFIALLLILLLTARATLAADTAQICADAAKKPVPATTQAPAGCSAYRAFYGIGQQADYDLASSCAFLERATELNSDTPFSGSAILTMIYADDARDIDLAIKFACEIERAAPAETEGRIAHLLTLRGHSGAPRFDLCDDVTSGFMTGYCESRDSDLAEQARKRKSADLLTGASGAERAAFDKLQKAGEVYFTLNAESTVGTSGTMHVALEIAAVEQQRTLFINTLAHLENRERSIEMSDDFATADRDLNGIYAKLLEWADPDEGITPEKLREAERSWIKYRDRWLDFAKLRYSDLTPDSIKTLLTRQRIAAINSALQGSL